MYVVNGKGSLIRVVAGLFVLGSVGLSFLHSPNWLYFTGLVGVMLMISAVTGFCPMELILKAVGVKQKIVSE